ncbi:MAG: efflux transporter periplasmic adaptor subunit, partial [Lentisphaeria bacterium]|nr:efflux transporter periplasmic adaptor subunit [Lentisphaeria bacterium]
VNLSAKQQHKYVAVAPSALIADADGYYIYVLDKNNKAVRRKIKTGRLADGLQIIREGLSSDDTVIVDGTHKVRHGMQVKAIPASQLK